MKISDALFPISSRLYENDFLPLARNLAYNWGKVSSIDGESLISK
jgi:hypothetical protein